MKALFIGGTGNISAAVSKMALEKGIDLYHLNRGNNSKIEGVKNIITDIYDLENTKRLLSGHKWDVVVNWIAFTPEDIQRDMDLFDENTNQYIFISSASAYQKPPENYIITESTPLSNPFWDYSRNKIACEQLLNSSYKEKKFPVTIVRPSHTYNTVIPITIGGWAEYTTVDRIKRGLPIVVQGDGTSLWTMTHAIDFAKGFIGLMNNQQAIGESFHITSDEVLTWNQIYQTIAKAAGCVAEIVHIPSDYIADFADITNYTSKRGSLLGDKAHSAVFDNSKIKRFVPDFVADIPFSQGIKQTLNWFEEDKSRMVIKEESNRFIDGLIENYGNKN
ncbi:MAG: SDR family oxidoreductase [Bacteroidales bacterium]|nr:SDR family oxidoreductase [Bacteroidales bacterium]